MVHARSARSMASLCKFECIVCEFPWSVSMTHDFMSIVCKTSSSPKEVVSVVCYVNPGICESALSKVNISIHGGCHLQVCMLYKYVNRRIERKVRVWSLGGKLFPFVSPPMYTFSDFASLLPREFHYILLCAWSPESRCHHAFVWLASSHLVSSRLSSVHVKCDSKSRLIFTS